MSEVMMSRYAGKPLLRLLELYVLWCIGELGEKDKEVLQQITPKLQETYSSSGAWYEIIEGVMDLPVAARQEVVAKWKQCVGEVATPQTFAENFVDENLT